MHFWQKTPNLHVSKVLEEASEKQASSVSSVGARISMIPLSDGSKTGEELHDDRSESTNSESVISLDIRCTTDGVLTQAEI